MNRVIFLLTPLLLFFAPMTFAATTPAPKPVCTTTCSTCTGQTPYTCCTYYTASCSYFPSADPAYPKPISKLPFSHLKTDPTSHSCTGDNGTVTCNGGTTSDTITRLKNTSSNCNISPSNDRLTPSSTVSCTYRDAQCGTACTKTKTCYSTYTYSCNCKTTCK
jgi:hypothetical protein